MDGTPQQFAQLSTSIREMAKEMPSSAVEIAHVAEAAGQLGVPIGAIKDFSKTEECSGNTLVNKVHDFLIYPPSIITQNT